MEVNPSKWFAIHRDKGMKDDKPAITLELLSRLQDGETVTAAATRQEFPTQPMTYQEKCHSAAADILLVSTLH